jgi:rhodanese-related sulfurtransferase
MKTLKKCLLALAFVCLGTVFAVAADKTGNDLVAEANKEIKSVTAQDAKKMIDGGNVMVLDVRELDEYEAEHIPNAVHIPRGLLEFQIASKAPMKDATIVTYCLKGGRGALSAQTLKVLGYTKVYNLTGGFVAWQAAKFPTEKGKK